MILRKGDNGTDVSLLQRRLTRAGYPVAETHVFDHETESAVMTLQRDRDLVVDGIAGPKTLIALPGVALPSHLTDADLVKAAGTLGVPVAAIRAVNEVESRGEGFLPDGRPVILFERHVFHARLKARGLDVDALAAQYPNIVSATRGGYMGKAAEYTRLAIAERIDADTAHESASWGAFQIMGYHWKALGYSSIADYVARMQRSEADHLDAFARFVAADTALVAALKGRKWAAFAKGYNGPDYARNLYDAKLARAFDRYAELENSRGRPREGRGVSALAARFGALAIALAALVAGWLYVKTLHTDLATAQLDAHDAQESVGRRDVLIANLRKQQRDSARQLAQLEAKRRDIAADLSARQSELENLKHESETVRAWADGALPDDVVRLYASPALTGGATEPVRAGDSLHDAGNVAAH